MTDLRLLHGDDYNTLFDSQAYLTSYYTDPMSGVMPFVLSEFHEAFAEGNIKGGVLLDIGTGPTVHSTMSASQHCDSVILADFSPTNRGILAQWHNRSLSHSFDKHLEFVLKLEGSSEIPSVREAMMRNKVACILHCDLRKDDPFSPNWLPPVDVITSSHCLESVAVDVPSYEYCAKRVAAMLKTGGHLVMVGCVGGSYYMVGKRCYSSYGMTGLELQSAWKKAGLQIMKWKELASTANDQSGDIYKYFSLVARKI
ncbi:nicotinamide N-methyltransferase-like [Haliotis rufescens]|uniref:nicotinamide N-methyltransferase-like n=1 Tax=Haliotis rufescens TaxID=6454 RepID=UPI00201E7B14|nr:nicotinamide N-methyltransferase-like [Haliotis rufescens]